MATRLTKIIANFETTLATTLAVGGETATLVSATDDDSVALPAGNYFFTLDVNDSTKKEHIVCALSGTSLTGIKTVTRQGVQTAGATKIHRVGAKVTLTDFAVIKEISDLLDGTTDLDGSVPLKYDTDPTLTDDKHLATKKYIDTVAGAGAAPASTTVLGVAKLSVAPADANTPIATGTNDPRIPTADEKAALDGTGTPSAANKYVTETDTNLTNNVKLTGDQTVAGVKTFSSSPLLPASDPTTDNQAARKAYVDSLMAVTTGSVSLGTVVPFGTNTVLSYNKIGKLYFNIAIIGDDTQSRKYPLSGGNAAAKFCELLSKTYSSSTNSQYISLSSGGSCSDGAYVATWNGSAWVTVNGGSSNSFQTTFIASIKVA